MRIAVTASPLIHQYPGNSGHFLYRLLNELVAENPAHEFIFLFDGDHNDKFIAAPNVRSLTVKPAARNFLSIKYWYDIKAPLALRKQKPDLWIQTGGIASLTTAIPQLLVLPGMPFLHYEKKRPFPNRGFFKKYTGSFLNKAWAIITLSESAKTEILARYPGINAEKLQAIEPAIEELYQPVNWQEKEIVKAGNADGREYFLFTGSRHAGYHIMTLLKAFSLFKKWQHSNMKLLLTNEMAKQQSDLAEKLRTYKYRDDVVILNKQTKEQMAGIVAAAYAVIHPPVFEDSGLPLLFAMQAGVPVIASDIPVLKETAGGAALYASPSDPDAIAQQMMLLYRDESLRTEFVNKVQERAGQFNIKRSARALWTIIAGTAKSKTG